MKVLERDFDKSRTQKEFSNVRWIYDFWAGLTESKAMKKVLELAAVKNGMTVLDMACGTGEMLEKIVQKNPDGSNIGIDLSPEMLKAADRKLNKLKQPNHMLKLGNALNIDCDDNSCDLLINNYMVDLMPENTFETIAGEFYRVLQPNGNLVMSTFSFGTKKIHRFWYWVAKNFPRLLTQCRPVSFSKYLTAAGFEIEADLQISQNTFPSEVIKARKMVKH